MEHVHQLTKLGIGTGGAVAIAASANGILRHRAAGLSPPLGFSTELIRWRGMDIHVTSAGDPDADDLILFHRPHLVGSSREFRAIVDTLAERYHVIAPDLPGFGCSERPPLVYSGRLYEDFMHEFTRDEADQPICIAPMLSAAYTLEAAQGSAMRALILVSPTTKATDRKYRRTRGLLRVPLIGTTVFNLMTSKPAIRKHLGRVVTNQAAITPEDIDYAWQSAHQPGARYSPASLLTGYLNVETDLVGAIARLDIPVTLVWGRNATNPSLEDGQEIAERAGCRLVAIDQSKALPHVDQPAAFLDVIRGELSPDQVTY